MKFLARFLLLLALPLSALAAAPPAWINYQGRLLDSAGIPVTATGMNFTVTIWNDPAATAPANLKYRESHVVNVNDGVYSFPVGSGTPISGAYNGSLYANNSVLWLELTVNTETLTPRHRLLSAPYTNHSGNSENLGGQPVSYFGTAATDAGLQEQINNLANQVGSLQVMCEMSHGYWDGSSCKPAIAVLVDPEKGDQYPISQLRLLWTESEPELECSEPHYHAYPNPGAGGIMPVKNCQGETTLEEPDSRGCAFGKASAVAYIPLSECEAFNVKGDGK